MRFLLVLFAAGTSIAASSPSPPSSTLIYTKSGLVAAKLIAATNHPRLNALRAAADKDMEAGPWSVTSERPKDTPAGSHDFYSEGPYWWPDPQNPGGPYIRRDGERNPDRFTANERDLNAMCESVLALGAASYLFDKPEYATRAAKIVSVWFLDDATKMNPNLRYGQAVHGRAEGRPDGLIAIRAFIWLLEGVRLAEESSGWDPQVSAGLKNWMREFQKWDLTSDLGRREGDAANNHASWWTAHNAAIAIYLGDHKIRDKMFEHYRSHLLKQFKPDGSAPLEEARTRSLSYSLFNATALAFICRFAELSGKDLGHYADKNNVTLTTVVEYLMPFFFNPSKWQHRQIEPLQREREYFLGLAGVALNRSSFIDYQARIGPTGGPSADWLSVLFEIDR